MHLGTEGINPAQITSLEDLQLFFSRCPSSDLGLDMKSNCGIPADFRALGGWAEDLVQAQVPTPCSQKTLANPTPEIYFPRKGNNDWTGALFSLSFLRSRRCVTWLTWCSRSADVAASGMRRERLHSSVSSVDKASQGLCLMSGLTNIETERN